MRILVCGGSIRASAANAELIVRLAETSDDVESLVANTKRLTSRGRRLSNSEILAAAALLGARTRGAAIDYFPLVSLFDAKEKGLFRLYPGANQHRYEFFDTLNMRDARYQALLDKLQAADGVVLSTPVYFGDRSSVANKVMQITARQGLLRDKVFGVVSVGAKRNGGQETCNIYSLVEACAQNALAVGNGPPTSQYGGTAVGGNEGHVLSDPWGLTTAVGTGHKVAHTCELFSRGAGTPDPVDIAVLVTSDTAQRFFHDHLLELTRRVSERLPRVRFSLFQLLDAAIYRCIGCRSCPYPGDELGEPRCRIREADDYLHTVVEALRRSDGFIVAGLNAVDSESVLFRYQVVTERMRAVRRNNFELTDKLVTGLSYSQFGATVNAMHNMKVLTSYIRHNTILHRPIDILEHEGKVFSDGLDQLADFCRAAARLKAGRKATLPPPCLYESHGIAGGYDDVPLCKMA